MTTSRQFLVGAVVAAAALIAVPAVPAAQASAQSGRQVLADRAASTTTTDATLNPAVMEDAQRFMTEGRFKDARRVYRSIIAGKRAAGEYAIEALQGLAKAEFALNDDRATAATLDELADAAGKFGDPETRIRSLLESALLYQGLKNNERVADHLAEIRVLLKSPAISEATRTDVTDRIPRR